MSFEPEIIEKIDLFLARQLPAAERAAFEKQVAAEPELARQVELQREQMDAMEILLADHLREKMKSWQTESQKTAPEISKTPFSKWWPWAIFAVVLGSLVFYFSQKNEKTPTEKPVVPPAVTDSMEKLVPENLQKNRPAPPIAEPAKKGSNPQNAVLKPNISEKYAAALRENDLEIARQLRDPSADLVRSDGAATLFSQGIGAAKRGKTAEALAFFQKIPATSPDRSDADFYEALICFEMGRVENALPILQNLVQNNSYLRQEQAEWLLAMSFLKTGKPGDAENLLKKIGAASGHSFGEKARRLLKK